MEITMYWGPTYIMTFVAYSQNEFIEKALGHAEKYWENLISESFSDAWRGLNCRGYGSSGRFDFFTDKS